MGLKELISSIGQGILEKVQARANTHTAQQPTFAVHRSTTNAEGRQSNGGNEGAGRVQQKMKALIDRLSPKAGTRARQGKLRKERTLKLSSRVVAEISDAVLAERSHQDQMSRLASKCQRLNDGIRELDRRASAFDVRARETELEDNVSDPGRLETTREMARIVRRTQARLQNTLEESEEELNQLTQEMHEDRRETYELMDKFLVKQRIIPGRPEDVANGSSNVHTTTNAVESVDDDQRRALQRSAGRPNLRELIHSSPTPSQHENRSIQDPKAKALDDYKFHKVLVGQAEADFEKRQETFDHEKDRLHYGRANGWTDETMSQLDRKHILQTQRLAQRLTTAEENLFAAKEAAVAAGVDFGPDAESGFAPRDDDGYSMSMEVDEKVSCDRDRINGWMEAFPDSGEGDAAWGDANVEMASRNGNEDDFELRSVEMSDTRSGIAEGGERRRIDKWNEIRFATAPV